MKLLLVGDMHVTPDSLEECNKLIDFICQTFKDNKADGIVFMGDQFHTFSLMHLSVMKFWQNSFKKLKEVSWQGRGVICALVGNHDRPGYENSGMHSMLLYSDVTIVDDFYVLDDSIVCVGFQFNKNKFLDLCRQNVGSKVLLCHQTFDGSYFENGFYAKDGIEPELVPQQLVISGHIHAQQKFDKIWYVGSPRWLTASDANQSKGIWLVDIDNGELKSSESFSTQDVCTPIWHFIDKEEKPVLDIKKGKVFIDIHGSIDYVNSRKLYFEELGCRVRTFPIKNFTSNIKESDGIGNSFIKFIEEFVPKNGTSKERLLELSNQRIGQLHG